MINLRRTILDLKVGTKLTLFTFSLVSCIFLGFIFFVVHTMSGSLEKRASETVNAQAQGIGNMIDTFNTNQLRTVEKFSHVFASLLPGRFSVDAQRTVDTGGTVVPVLKLDDTDINLNFEAVDRFSSMTGGNATVFIKHGDDFVRVATSVKKADGNRAVGTRLGQAHPAYQSLMQGKAYRGMAVLFGKPHATEYVPIKALDNTVIGILYVGVDISADVAALKDRIRSLKVGDSGYFIVVNAREGDAYGTFVVHPQNEGQKGLELRDTRGREFIRDMLQSGNGSMRVTPVDASGAPQPEQMLVYQGNKDWNWTIAGVAMVDEISHDVVALRNTLLLAGVLALAGFAAALLLIVRRVVSRPLKAASIAAERLAQGDLTVRLTPASQDEIGSLMTAMNGISNGLATVVAAIRQGTDQVATASAQIAAGNQDLSSRTEHQAGALEETASSMDELTEAVKQNADNARQAHQLVATASSVATRGGAVVFQVVATMDAINDSSRKIVDIINVIDGIAFQTNILALNAAVEAARAGEQGRGFAVVAAEVRSLAQRSASAAKEIKLLIDDSVDKVKTGSSLVADAGHTMNDVVSSVQQVAVFMADIVTASQEQSTGIQEMNQALASMDQVTQQNAALVEEAAAAAHSLEEMSATLARSVSVFRLAGPQAAPATPALSHQPG